MKNKSMQRGFCTFWAGVWLALSLAGCGAQVSVGESKNMPVQSDGSALQMLTNPSNTLCPKDQTETGFYEVISRGERTLNVIYTDYVTKSRIYLCNDPGCNHASDSCTSFLNASTAEQVFSAGDQLYLQISLYTEDDIASKLIRMRPDGTNRETLLSMESGKRLEGSYATDGKILYYTTLEYAEVPEEEKETNDGMEMHLNGLNLETGETNLLYNFGTNCMWSKRWVGCVERELIFCETVTPNIEEPEKFAHLYQAFSIDTQQWRDITPEPIFEGPGIWADGMDLWLSNDGMTLNTLTYATGEIRHVALKQQVPEDAYVPFVRDGKLLATWSGPSGTKYVGIDSETGSITDAMYYVAKPSEQKGVMDILASFGDEYLVITTPIQVSQMYYNVDGTSGSDVREVWPQALISKEDYWAGRDNLTMIDDRVNR